MFLLAIIFERATLLEEIKNIGSFQILFINWASLIKIGLKIPQINVIYKNPDFMLETLFSYAISSYRILLKLKLKQDSLKDSPHSVLLCEYWWINQSLLSELLLATSVEVGLSD